MPFFRRLSDRILIREIRGEGMMRQPVLVSCTLVIFIVTFASVYISFRASAPHVRGLVGGGFFLLASLLLLWREFAPSGLIRLIERRGSAT